MASKRGNPGNSGGKAFAELVGEKNTEALKPFIAQQIKMLGSDLARHQLRAQGDLITNDGALRSLLYKKGVITENEFYEERFLIEDSALGYIESKEAAKLGDYCRISCRSKKPEDAEYGGEQNFAINDLGNAPYNLPKELEEAVIGMTKNEVKVTTIPQQEQKLEVELTLNRISFKPSPLKPVEDLPKEDK